MSKYQPTERVEDYPCGTRIIQNHGRVQIPKEIRVILRIGDGDKVLWVVDIHNKVTLKKVQRMENGKG